MSLIKCPECNHEISDKAKMCPHCGFELPKKEPIFQGEYCPSCLKCCTKIDDKYDKCPFCHIEMKYSITGAFDEVFDFAKNHPELKQSPEFSEEAYQRRINHVPYEYNNSNKVKCPTCASTNVPKIETGERMASVAMMGIFSKKINKSFKCKSCGYTW